MSVAQDGVIWFGKRITVELGTGPDEAIAIWDERVKLESLTSAQARDLATELLKWADVQDRILRR